MADSRGNGTMPKSPAGCLEDTQAQNCAASGVRGLDTILGGGFPVGRVHLVEGRPGTGKSTLGLQFLLEGRRRGERCLYVSLADARVELHATEKSHGWSLKGIEIAALETIDPLSDGVDQTVFLPSELELAEATRKLMSTIEQIEPQRAVFDSVSEVRLMCADPLRWWRHVMLWKDFFVRRNCTALLLDDDPQPRRMNRLHNLADGIVQLVRQGSRFGSDQRRARIAKLRGCRYEEGCHDYAISRGGMIVFSRLAYGVMSRTSSLPAEVFSTGIEALDRQLGGGLDRGCSVLLIGPPGTGKSTVALQLALAAAERNEPTLYYLFDELPHSLIARAQSIGLDVATPVAHGLISLRRIEPGSISPGELLCQACAAAEEGGARLVVLDSVEGCARAMPGRAFLSLRLRELLSCLGHRGVNAVLVAAAPDFREPAAASLGKVSAMADTILKFWYYDVRGEVRHAVFVSKRRAGAHERTPRDLQIGPAGLRVGDPVAHC
jgi:circadian clock protein KaiC